MAPSTLYQIGVVEDKNTTQLKAKNSLSKFWL